MAKKETGRQRKKRRTARTETFKNPDLRKPHKHLVVAIVTMLLAVVATF